MTKNNNSQDLDKIFEALASKHRREIIYALSLEPNTISQLASMRNLSLPAIHKHIKLLEKAKLVIRKKSGQTNFLSFNRNSLLSLQKWTNQFITYWGNNHETLKNYEKYLSINNSLKGGEKK